MGDDITVIPRRYVQVGTSLPSSGEFDGQIFYDSNDDTAYVWDESSSKWIATSASPDGLTIDKNANGDLEALYPLSEIVKTYLAYSSMSTKNEGYLEIASSKVKVNSIKVFSKGSASNDVKLEFIDQSDSSVIKDIALGTAFGDTTTEFVVDKSVKATGNVGLRVYDAANGGNLAVGTGANPNDPWNLSSYINQFGSKGAWIPATSSAKEVIDFEVLQKW